MEAESTTVVDAVAAPLNYLAPTTDRPFAYAYEPPPGMPQRHGEIDRRIVAIRDGRPFARDFAQRGEGNVTNDLREHLVDGAEDHEGDYVGAKRGGINHASEQQAIAIVRQEAQDR